MAGLPSLLRYEKARNRHVRKLTDPAAQADEARECRFPLSDYMECLHHGAEVVALDSGRIERWLIKDADSACSDR